MSPSLHYECTRVPVTALATCGPLLVAAEGPFLRFYHVQDSRYICSEQIFKAQAIHGVSVYSDTPDALILLIWGGWLICALTIDLSLLGDEDQFSISALHPSESVKASDWILHLASQSLSSKNSCSSEKGSCAAVTAHNALLEVTVEKADNAPHTRQQLVVSVYELTSSSRSILYSAHLLWESQNTVLVAAGTAFGEIIFWSWTRDSISGSQSRIHQVFLGHEGSIFGVQISDQLVSSNLPFKRLLASCSDDRTIRIWDISEFSAESNSFPQLKEDVDAQRTRHTGFSNEYFDPDLSSSTCVAIGWGHISRVWAVRFLDMSLAEEICLLSSGEDATSRIWKLTANAKDDSFKLIHSHNAGYHNGKNIWSTTVRILPKGLQQVFRGAADSKLTSYYVPGIRNLEQIGTGFRSFEYTVQDIVSLENASTEALHAVTSSLGHKSSRAAEFFRSYTFIDESSFLLTTNSGKVYLETLHSGPRRNVSGSKLVCQEEDLIGYSVCTGDSSLGVAFFASSKGGIYMYTRQDPRVSKIHSLNGKVGDLFLAKSPGGLSHQKLVLLVTLLGQKVAHLINVDTMAERTTNITKDVLVPISEMSAGLAITSMAYVGLNQGTEYLLLGFRRGSVAVYSLAKGAEGVENNANPDIKLLKIIENVHGNETVTALSWIPSLEDSPSGHLLSSGRDSCIAVYSINLASNTVELVHRLTLPIGPNIEGLYFHHDQLLAHGFSSKKWVLYNITTEEEVISVETGGSHRTWVFEPEKSPIGGGTLVWTRASSMHICSQSGPEHQVIRSGEHGREVKAVTVSPQVNCDGQSRRLIATGAEDTDIKLFEYVEGTFTCRRTLKKHTTGIQHLQWSVDGDYLFSSGGCEEFYIWRVRQLPSFMRIGVVCEFVYTPESEHADLRVMSFDVAQIKNGFTVAMVFSDSSIKVYNYNPTAATKWSAVAKGIYFTSCLTQAVFLSPTKILTIGTDGHSVVWFLSPNTSTIHEDTTEHVSTIVWKYPARIHQNSSKTLTTFAFTEDITLIISGGDDGSLAFLCARSSAHSSTSSVSPYVEPPLVVARTHASAVTASAVFSLQSRIFVLTSGNDQWIRLWEVIANSGQDALEIKRVKKIKTSVADVSSMAVLHAGESFAQLLICGVGMELIRVQ